MSYPLVLVDGCIAQQPVDETLVMRGHLNVHSYIITADGDLLLIPGVDQAIQADDAGDARGNYAVDFQMDRTNDDQVASGFGSVIGGGQNNKNVGSRSVICGGFGNIIVSSANYCVICGGAENEMQTGTSDYSFIGGGNQNTIDGYRGVIGGGQINSIDGDYNTIGGGLSNEIIGKRSTIGGGADHEVYADYGTVGGGADNSVFDDFGFVGGGTGNLCSGVCSVIVGGYRNVTEGSYCVVCGGASNEARGPYSTILGGQANRTTAGYATAMGAFASASRHGEVAQAAGSFSSDPGQAQTGVMTAYTSTSGTGWVEMLLDNDVEHIVIPVDATCLFKIHIIAAGTTSTTQRAAFCIECLVTRNGTGNPTFSWHPSPTVLLSYSTCNVEYDIDPFSDSLLLKVCGVSGITFNWMARIVCTQVGV